MNHPKIVNANATERLNRMLQETEEHCLMNKVAGQKPARNLSYALKKLFPILSGHSMEKSASSPV
jgi:hypothetical protein